MTRKLLPLGTILHVTPDPEIIVRLESSMHLPKKGVKVLMKTMKWVGVTTNPFGPVQAPYIGVVPHESFHDFSRIKPGDFLYTFTNEQPKRTKKVHQNQKKNSSHKSKKFKGYKKFRSKER